MRIIWTFTLLMIPGVVISMNMTGYPGGEVVIKCTYEAKYTQNTKYFCRELKPNTQLIGWCSDLIRTDKKNKWVKDGRFSLYDNTRAAVFTVTFRDLSEQDSGTYQCGVDRAIITDSYTEVNIIIGSSLIIVVSVVLLLLIIGLVSCVVTVCMKRWAQAKGSDSVFKMPEPGTENSDAVPQTLYIYDEIKDTRPHPDCKTAHLPTDPSGSITTVYATPQLPTNPSGSITTVYATPQLPTNPSVEGHKQCKNQLPTNPSDSCTVYATPGLHITPSGSTNTIYDNPQLPTNPSDSTKTVYATL